MAWDITKGLRTWWSKREEDWMIDFPRKCDGWLLHNLMAGSISWPEFIKELEQRNYDLKTLKLSVKRKDVQDEVSNI